MQWMKRTFKLSEIDEIASFISDLLTQYQVACFEGNLGAGKTTLISAICKKLSVIDTVTSPTFSILNVYQTKPGSRYAQIVHADLYRISSEEEAVRAGIEEYFYGNACCMVEWPQKAPGILPDTFLSITLSVIDQDERLIEVNSGEK